MILGHTHRMQSPNIQIVKIIIKKFGYFVINIHVVIFRDRYTCQDLLTAFIRTINWGSKHLKVNLFPNDFQRHVNSLHIFHYKGFTSGIRHRIILEHATKIDTFCRHHLSYRTDLKVQIPHVIPTPWIQVPDTSCSCRVVVVCCLPFLFV